MFLHALHHAQRPVIARDVAHPLVEVLGQQVTHGVVRVGDQYAGCAALEGPQRGGVGFAAHLDAGAFVLAAALTRPPNSGGLTCTHDATPHTPSISTLMTTFIALSVAGSALIKQMTALGAGGDGPGRELAGFPGEWATFGPLSAVYAGPELPINVALGATDEASRGA